MHIKLVVTRVDVRRADINGRRTGIPIIHLATVHIEHCYGLCVVPVVIVQNNRAVSIRRYSIATDFSAVQIQGGANIGARHRSHFNSASGCFFDLTAALAIADIQRSVALYRNTAGQRLSVQAEVEGATRDGERFAPRRIVRQVNIGGIVLVVGNVARSVPCRPFDSFARPRMVADLLVGRAADRVRMRAVIRRADPHHEERGTQKQRDEKQSLPNFHRSFSPLSVFRKIFCPFTDLTFREILL